MNTDDINPPFLVAAVFVTTLTLGACKVGEYPQEALETANLEKAIYCMDLLEIRKDLEAVRRECIADTYIQHTPWVADGREAVLDYFATRFENHPDFSIEIKRAGADGDLVWIHLHAKDQPDSLGAAVINIFRMKDGKFVEHWNVAQAVPEESKNDNTMF